MAAQAADGVQRRWVDVMVGGVDGIGGEMGEDDFAEDDFAGIADAQGGVLAAFEGGGGFGDPGTGDFGARADGEAGGG